MQVVDAIQKYENAMLGKTRLLLRGTKSETEQAALAIVRYVVTELMEITPKQAMRIMTKDLAEAYGISKLSSYIQVPDDVNLKYDWYYIIHLAFPKETVVELRERVIRYYLRILKGDQERFPKKYFEGIEGREKAYVLLQYIILTRCDQGTIKDLYYAFADSANINKKLKEWKVNNVCANYFLTPLDWFHNSLDEDQRDEFLYKFLQHRSVYDAFDYDLAAEEKKLERAKKRKVVNM